MASRWVLTLVIPFIGLSGVALAEEAPGKLVYTRGTTSAQQSDGALRILSENAAVQLGETLQTGRESFAILELADGTRVVLRPDTRMVVAAPEAPAAAATPAPRNDSTFVERAASFVLKLLGGGVRASSGVDANGEPTALHIDAPNGRVEGQGVELVARVCAEDCAAERASETPVATVAIPAVARALIVRGRVQRIDAAGTSQRIRSGAALQVGDVVSTSGSSHAVLAFSDGARATVQPRSRFAVEEYQLAADNVGEEKMSLRVQSGGARIATGGIARRDLSHARFATPLATIGVRGTGFDLLEATECGGKPAPTERPGLTASVWAGTIEFQETKTQVPAGKTVCVLQPGQVPVPVKDAPKLDTPRPDEVAVPDDLFSSTEQSGAAAGLHVSVLSGEVRVLSGGTEVLLGAGEDGFADSSRSLRTIGAQSVGRSDPYLALDLGKPASWDSFEPAFGVMCPAP